MTKFTLDRAKKIKGKLKFYYLKVDGKVLFSDFEESVKKDGGYENELIHIQSIMQQLAELESLPNSKFKDITPKKVSVKEYEIKTKNLRVYLFKDVKGKVIVMGGKKPKQPKDIVKFRKIKKQYLNQL